MTGEVGNIDPGKYEKTLVVDHEVQAFLAILAGPADPLIPILEVPSGGRKKQAAENLTLRGVGDDEIVKRRPNGMVIAQVVIAIDQLFPER